MAIGRVIATVLFCAILPGAPGEEGFRQLFDGKTLRGWKQVDTKGQGYTVDDGLLVCAADCGGRILTEEEFTDFTLRFEYRLAPGGNNGVNIRAPYEGRPAYAGMEIQILDDSDPQYARLRPAQFHGSIYGVVPARRGALKPPGAWNGEEIRCEGRRVRVTLNGNVSVYIDKADAGRRVGKVAHVDGLRNHVQVEGNVPDAELRKIGRAHV